jgi:hypothetical protein
VGHIAINDVAGPSGRALSHFSRATSDERQLGLPPRSAHGLGAESEEKREPATDIDTVSADSLKALDLDRPIEKRT